MYKRQHLYCTEDSEKPPHTFQVRADLIEWLGADAYVHFEMDPGDWSADMSSLPEELDRKLTGKSRTSLTARLDPARKIASGELLTLAINHEKLHLFEIQSGLNVLRQK